MSVAEQPPQPVRGEGSDAVQCGSPASVSSDKTQKSPSSGSANSWTTVSAPRDDTRPAPIVTDTAQNGGLPSVANSALTSASDTGSVTAMDSTFSDQSTVIQDPFSPTYPPQSTALILYPGSFSHHRSSFTTPHHSPGRKHERSHSRVAYPQPHPIVIPPQHSPITLTRIRSCSSHSRSTSSHRRPCILLGSDSEPQSPRRGRSRSPRALEHVGYPPGYAYLGSGRPPTSDPSPIMHPMDDIYPQLPPSPLWSPTSPPSAPRVIVPLSGELSVHHTSSTHGGRPLPSPTQVALPAASRSEVSALNSSWSPPSHLRRETSTTSRSSLSALSEDLHRLSPRGPRSPMGPRTPLTPARIPLPASHRPSPRPVAQSTLEPDAAIHVPPPTSHQTSPRPSHRASPSRHSNESSPRRHLSLLEQYQNATLPVTDLGTPVSLSPFSTSSSRSNYSPRSHADTRSRLEWNSPTESESDYDFGPVSPAYGPEIRAPHPESEVYGDASVSGRDGVQFPSASTSTGLSRSSSVYSRGTPPTVSVNARPGPTSPYPQPTIVSGDRFAPMRPHRASGVSPSDAPAPLIQNSSQTLRRPWEDANERDLGFPCRLTNSPHRKEAASSQQLYMGEATPAPVYNVSEEATRMDGCSREPPPPLPPTWTRPHKGGSDNGTCGTSTSSQYSFIVEPQPEPRREPSLAESYSSQDGMSTWDPQGGVRGPGEPPHELVRSPFVSPSFIPISAIVTSRGSAKHGGGSGGSADGPAPSHVDRPPVDTQSAQVIAEAAARINAAAHANATANAHNASHAQATVQATAQAAAHASAEPVTAISLPSSRRASNEAAPSPPRSTVMSPTSHSTPPASPRYLGPPPPIIGISLSPVSHASLLPVSASLPCNNFDPGSVTPPSVPSSSSRSPSPPTRRRVYTPTPPRQVSPSASPVPSRVPPCIIHDVGSSRSRSRSRSRSPPRQPLLIVDSETPGSRYLPFPANGRPIIMPGSVSSSRSSSRSVRRVPTSLPGPSWPAQMPWEQPRGQGHVGGNQSTRPCGQTTQASPLRSPLRPPVVLIPVSPSRDTERPRSCSRSAYHGRRPEPPESQGNLHNHRDRRSRSRSGRRGSGHRLSYLRALDDHRHDRRYWSPSRSRSRSTTVYRRPRRSPSPTPSVSSTHVPYHNGSPAPQRSAQFYFSDGTLFVRVEDVVFRVYRHFFEKSSSVWLQMLRNRLVGVKSNPLVLTDVKAADFEQLLCLVYPDFTGPGPTTAEQWTGVLTLASQWKIDPLFKLAVQKVEPLLSPVDKLVLGNKYDIDGWAKAAYEELCLRRAPLSKEEGRKLGVDAVVKINEMKFALMENLGAMVDREKLTSVVEGVMNQ
ncbi:hypothetical protein BD626DRAFT_472357 [Schizophyllum amplum]|uniref:BTB domain-containing protein n=1 Tax=Schizophyllum amplum TaxID=97359 RepID=A0A550CVX2_9AGAR|nr:hypothetical protein BD626DRAFT_472357 [Auriculariopsis ampla]